MSQELSINCKGKLLTLGKPLVMGVINTNDNSFYKGSRVTDRDQILQKTAQMIIEGADIIDLGVMTSKPGAQLSDPNQELETILPILKIIKTSFSDIVISVDTIHSKVAEVVLNEGASIINDITGGTFDSNMYGIVAAAKSPYVMMHIQGLPSNMQDNPIYDDVVMDISKYFVSNIRKAKDAGITDIILDPGFGFGKTLDHNFDILRQFEVFKIFDFPLLAGISRKSMIWKTLDSDPENALNGTTALNMILLQKGANILRVHDVKEAVECVKLYNRLKG